MIKNLVIILLLTASIPAQAHGWYDKACCADKDCHPVNCADVTFNSVGDFIWHDIIFYKASMKPSQDGGCHVCTGGDPPRFGRCIYMPWSG